MGGKLRCRCGAAVADTRSVRRLWTQFSDRCRENGWPPIPTNRAPICELCRVDWQGAADRRACENLLGECWLWGLCWQIEQAGDPEQFLATAPPWFLERFAGRIEELIVSNTREQA